jgi:PTS system mannose-specific IIA component
MFLSDPNVEVVTGVNLPMIVKLAGQLPEESLTDLARRVRDHGKDGIHRAGEILNES